MIGVVWYGLGFVDVAGDFFEMLGDRAERAGELETEECGLLFIRGGFGFASYLASGFISRAMGLMVPFSILTMMESCIGANVAAGSALNPNSSGLNILPMGKG